MSEQKQPEGPSGIDRRELLVRVSQVTVAGVVLSPGRLLAAQEQVRKQNPQPPEDPDFQIERFGKE